MKKTGQINFKLDPEALAVFKRSCKERGIMASVVIRDLCAAAIPYMAEHCPAGRWIAPELVPFGTSAKAEPPVVRDAQRIVRQVEDAEAWLQRERAEASDRPIVQVVTGKRNRTKAKVKGGGR
jgi:hypothetical protein